MSEVKISGLKHTISGKRRHSKNKKLLDKSGFFCKWCLISFSITQKSVKNTKNWNFWIFEKKMMQGSEVVGIKKSVFSKIEFTDR